MNYFKVKIYSAKRKYLVFGVLIAAIASILFASCKQRQDYSEVKGKLECPPWLSTDTQIKLRNKSELVKKNVWKGQQDPNIKTVAHLRDIEGNTNSNYNGSLNNLKCKVGNADDALIGRELPVNSVYKITSCKYEPIYTSGSYSGFYLEMDVVPKTNEGTYIVCWFHTDLEKKLFDNFFDKI